MKRNISDLLDTYMEEDVELEAETVLSPTRIKELTMNKLDQKNHTEKKTGKRFPVRVFIAAAAVAAMSVTALAADIGGVGSTLQSYFAKDGDSLSAGQIQAIDQLGATFSGGVTSQGATLTPLAAVADENVYYLRLRVEAPQGTVLPDLDEETGYYQLFGGETKNSLDLDLSAYDGAYSPGYSVDYTWMPDQDPADNMKEVVLRYQVLPEDGEESGALKFNDGVSKVLTIRGLWVQAPDKEYTQVFGGTFTFDIGKNFESQSVALDCAGLSYHDETFDITSAPDTMTLSPLSLSCEYKCTLQENQWVGWGVGPIKIVLKDGTAFFDDTEGYSFTGNQISDIPIADLPRSQEPSSVHRMMIPFDEPLDLTKVDYVEYGGEKIPVNVG